MKMNVLKKALLVAGMAVMTAAAPMSAYAGYSGTVDATQNEFNILEVKQGYTITYELNGGSWASGYTAQTSVDAGSSVTLPTADDVERTDYVFDGWYVDSGFTGSAVTEFDSTQADDVTVYAKWTELTAMFKSGGLVNIAMKQLAGNASAGPISSDSSVTAFAHYDGTPDLTSLETQVVSTDDSTAEIYAWYDGGTIYWWSEASTVKAGESTASSLFYNLTSLEAIDLGGIDWSGITTTDGMFFECTSLATVDLSQLDTSNVTNMGRMFYKCEALESIDLSALDTQHVVYMNSMFHSCTSLQSLDLIGFDTRGVEDMSMMFAKSGIETLDMSVLDTSSVTDMSYMFHSCTSLMEITLTGIDISNVTNMNYMFYNCTNLTTIYETQDWAEYGVTSYSNMFTNCESIVGGGNTTYDASHVDIAYAHPGTVANPGYFVNPDNVAEFGSGRTNVTAKLKQLAGNSSAKYSTSDSKITAFAHYDGTPDLTLLTTQVVSSTDSPVEIYAWYDSGTIYWWSEADIVKAGGDMLYYMFFNCTSLESVDFSGIDMSSATNGQYAFSGCSSLTTLNLGNLNEAEFGNTARMFYGCSSLGSLDLSGFNMTGVISTEYMFYNCTSLITLDLSDVAINSNQTDTLDMDSMFSGCSKLTNLNLDGFSAYNIGNTYSMFGSCKGLQSLDLSGFDTTNTETMGYMFAGCTGLTSLNVSSFSTSNVTDMAHMFYYCSSLTDLNLSNFDTSSVTITEMMFYKCSNLTSLDLTNFDISGITSTYKIDMMSGTAATSQSCAVTCTTATKSALLSGTSITESYFTWILTDGTNSLSLTLDANGGTLENGESTLTVTVDESETLSEE